GERIAEPPHVGHRALAGGGVASHIDTGRLESFDGSVHRLADLPAQVEELVAVAGMDGDPPRRGVDASRTVPSLPSVATSAPRISGPRREREQKDDRRRWDHQPPEALTEDEEQKAKYLTRGAATKKWRARAHSRRGGGGRRRGSRGLRCGG